MAFAEGQFVVWDGRCALVRRQVGTSVWIDVEGVDTVVSETALHMENPAHLPRAARLQLPDDCEDDGS